LSPPANACQPRRNVEIVDEEEEMEFSLFRIGCASGVCLVIMLGTYNMIFAPVTDVNPNHPPRRPALKPNDYPKFPPVDRPPVQKPFPAIDRPPVQKPFPAIDRPLVQKPFPAIDRPPVQKPFPAFVEPDVVGFPSDFGYVKKPPVSIPDPKNPNNKPPKNHLPKKKWWEEDFSKKSFDDVTPGYDPLADIDPFVWDGTKKPEKSVDDEYIYPRVFDPSCNWDGTKEPKKKDDKRPPPLPLKIEPEGFVPPVWNNPKKVDGRYDPNWDRPRFVKEEKTPSEFDDDDVYLPGFDDDYKPPVWESPKKVNNGKYDPNWDRPRFVKEKTMSAFDDDNFYHETDNEYKPPVRKNPKKVVKGSFDRPGFSAGRNQAPIKNDLAPEWDDEDYYAPKYSSKKKERTSFQAVDW